MRGRIFCRVWIPFMENNEVLWRESPKEPSSGLTNIASPTSTNRDSSESNKTFPQHSRMRHRQQNADSHKSSNPPPPADSQFDQGIMPM